ncbi:ribonuclease H-like protein, partial [Myriangium duriaei CBS 260.36]
VSAPPSTSVIPSIITPLPASVKNAGLIPAVKAGRYLSLDCEMVSTVNTTSRLARVSIVNYHLQPVYDSFVLPSPSDPVVDYRTSVSGIRPADLRRGYARPLAQVQADVAALLAGKVLVGHALRNDLEALGTKHDGWAVRDTVKAKTYRALAGGRSPALRELSRRVLGVEIQGGEHCSVVDARAAMELYKREKNGMDEEVRRKYGRL